MIIFVKECYVVYLSYWGRISILLWAICLFTINPNWQEMKLLWTSIITTLQEYTKQEKKKEEKEEWNWPIRHTMDNFSPVTLLQRSTFIFKRHSNHKPALIQYSRIANSKIRFIESEQACCCGSSSPSILILLCYNAPFT